MQFQRQRCFAVGMAIAMLLVAAECRAQDTKKETTPLKQIRYLSKADDTEQPARFHASQSKEPAPLLVVLHTWSGNWRQDYHDDALKQAIAKGWTVIHPNFRGRNNNPKACGSELVVQDILSAVDYAKANANVDEKRIYLLGASGGGYASLLMAGRAPQVWAGVSAWVGIVDLAAWHAECTERKLNYADQIARSCGGKPGDGPEVDEQYRKRSARTYLAKAKGLPLDINAGIKDGHSGSVPISHSLNAFNLVADEKDRIPESDIRHMTEKAEVPDRLKAEIDDPSYGRKAPLFRRTSGKARVTIFRGGHELVCNAALAWLEKQKKD